MLKGGISQEVVETLKCLTQGPLSDFIENQNFSSLHRIVLKLSLKDLEEEILQNADDVDIPDAMGRTALEWAAARGEEIGMRGLVQRRICPPPLAPPWPTCQAEG